MSASKYDPPAERTEESPCIGVVPDGSSTFRLVIYGKVACSRREDADAALQKLALAIADRVHGAELARLRAVLREVQEAVGVWDLGTDLDGRIRELLPTAPAVPYKPTLVEEAESWLVYFGPREEDVNEHFQLSEAAADFGERYAAWKASQR